MEKFKPFLDQNYEKLKAASLKSGKLFEDDKFPANDSSIYRFRNFYGKPIIWKRPYELFSDPKFVVDGIVPTDLDQGQIGNCWLIAAAASVLNVPEYFKRNIPENQTFDKGNYAGIFHFRFWYYGQWVDVVVDDKIPVNQNNQLIFCKNLVDKNEMFGPLLEKAYAKISICYEFLIGGFSKNAMIDFTGGVNEKYDLTRCLPSAKDRHISPDILWELIFRSYNLKALLSCSADVKKNQKIEDEDSNGLHVGHAYSILAVYEIIKVNGQFNEFRIKDQSVDPKQTIRLLLIRNPWGKKPKYNGAWSLGTQDWKKVGPKIIDELKPDNQSDGQFFMEFKDFYSFFCKMDTVHVDMDGLSNSQNSNQENLEWKMIQIHGEWVSGKNAGGSPNDQVSFWTNPQHILKITETKNQSAVVISLMQKETSHNRMNTDGVSRGVYEAIGVYVYSIKNDSKPDSNGSYNKSNLVLKTSTKTFIYQKEISKRIELEPGDYVVIPCCFDKNKSASYILRFYIETIKNKIVTKPLIIEQDNPKIYIQNKDNSSNLNSSKLKDEKEKKILLPTHGEMYDKWYYSGMNQKDIEKLRIQAQDFTSKICMIM